MALKPFNSVAGFSTGETQVTIINSDGNIAANALTVSATANVTGNLTAGNIATTGTANIGTAVVTGNISGGNIATLGTANVGTLDVTGNAGVTGNITGGNIATLGTANVGTLAVTGNAGVTGNVSGGNISTAGTANVGTLDVTGNANVNVLNVTTDTNIGGNALITGNLTVEGNLIYVNVESLNVEDPIITVGTGPNGASLTTNDGKDRGVAMEYFATTAKFAYAGYKNATGTYSGDYVIAKEATLSDDVVTVVELANVVAGIYKGTFTAPGNVTEILFNEGGNIGAHPNLTYNSSTQTLSVDNFSAVGDAEFGNISANLANITNIQSEQVQVIRTNQPPGFSGYILDTYSNDDDTQAYVGRKSRGTPEAPLPIQAGDALARFGGRARTSSDGFQTAGGITIRSTGLPASNTAFVPSKVILFSYDSSNLVHNLILTENGNIFSDGRILTVLYDNTSDASAFVAARARGTAAAPLSLEIGDQIDSSRAVGYSGNGTSTINGVTGFATAGRTYFDVTNVPSSANNISTDFYIQLFDTSNVSIEAKFDTDGNFTIPGSFNGVAANLTGNISGGNIATVGTANIGTLEVTGEANVTGNLNVTETATANIVSITTQAEIAGTSIVSAGIVATSSTTPTTLFTGGSGFGYEVTVKASDGANIMITKVLATPAGDYTVYGQTVTGNAPGSISVSSAANTVTVTVTSAAATPTTYTYQATGL